MEHPGLCEIVVIEGRNRDCLLRLGYLSHLIDCAAGYVNNPERPA
jgi:hypothetical protein